MAKSAASFLDETAPETTADKLEQARSAVPGSGMADAVFNGLTFGYGDTITHAINSALGRTGKETAKAQDTSRDAYKRDHPYREAAGETAGAALNPLLAKGTKLLGKVPGLARVGKIAAPAAGAAGAAVGYHSGGVKDAVEDAAEGATAARYIVPAVAGGAMSSLMASGEAKPGHRLEAAKDAFLPGAALGGVIHAGGGALGSAVEAADARSGFKGTQLVDKARTALTGETPKLSPAERYAARRLRTPLAQDKTSASGTATEQARRKAAGVGEGNLQETTGQNTLRTVRAAARRMGDGTNAAREASDASQINQPARAAERISRIHNYAGTAEQRGDQLRTARAEEAERKYRAPYAQPVELDDKMMGLLANRELKEPLDFAERTATARGYEHPESANQAREIQSIRQYQDQVEQHGQEHAAWEKERDAHEQRVADWKASGGYDASGLDKAAKDLFNGAESPANKARVAEALGLKKVPEPEMRSEPPRPAPPTVSGGTLDRIRINAGDVAQGHVEAGRRGLGGAIHKMAADIDTHLDSVPHLEEARGAYREKSQQIEAVESGPKVLNEKPGNFKAYVDGLPASARDDLKIAIRDELMGQTQKGTGTIGTLRALGRGAYGRQNLAHLFGQEEADHLAEAAHYIRQDTERAQFVAGAGSQTAMNQEDMKSVTQLAHSLMSPMGHARQAIEDLLHGGYTMSPEEAHAIVKFAQGDPKVLIDHLNANPHSPLVGAIRTAMAGAGGAAYGQGGGNDAYIEQKLPEPVSPPSAPPGQSAESFLDAPQ